MRLLISQALENVKKIKTGFNQEIIEELIKRKVKAEFRYFKSCGWSKTEIKEHLEKWELTEEALKDWFEELREIRKAILNKRLVIRWKGGLYWSVGYLKNNEITELDLITMETLGIYKVNYNKRAHCVGVYGTNRAVELVLKYGYSLGLEFEKIPQQQQILY